MKLPIFPCTPTNKRPYTGHGFYDATNDEAQLKRWKQQYPDAMWGVPMGPVSGMFCVDLDRKPGKGDGVATWEAWLSENGSVETRTHITPSTGKHLLFRYRDWISNIPLDALGPGIEIKGKGGYVIYPPSRMADGREYVVENGAAIAEAPQWLLDKVYHYVLEKMLNQDAGKGIHLDSDFEQPRINEKPDQNKVRAALQVIPSDDYKEWYKIMGALYHEFESSGYSLFEEWSRKSKKFNAKECAKKWEKAPDITEVTAGTIFYLADEHDPGWRDRYEASLASKQTASKQSTTTTDDTINAEDLMRMEFPPVRFIVPGYVVEGLTVVGGKPKAGKSWWAYDACIAVATGGLAMGAVECEQGDVLYLCLEDNRRRVKTRINTIRPYSDKLGGLERLTIRTRARKVGEGLSAELEEWRTKAKNPRLIVIDVWIRVRPPRLRNADLYAADYAAAEPLQRYATQHELGLVIITHTRKLEASDPLESISGTNGVTGVADSVLVLTRTAECSKIYGRGRDMADIETALAFNGGRWSVLGSVEDVQRSEQRKRILSALEEAGKPLSPKELADITGMKHGNVRVTLMRMGQKGEVVAQGGRYRVAPAQKDMAGI